tara:strand:- start:65 stop:484 length:420 start_codon:yes stop_codon:yes gene_type:complete
MNPSLNININKVELDEFKSQVKKWLSIDEEIIELETKIKNLKKLKNKELTPKITSFMINFNISDLNTSQGKIRCNERNRKKPLNKTNIRENLSQVISDDSQIEQAMQLIMNNRENIKSFILTKPKVKNNNKQVLPIDPS